MSRPRGAIYVATSCGTHLLLAHVDNDHYRRWSLQVQAQPATKQSRSPVSHYVYKISMFALKWFFKYSYQFIFSTVLFHFVEHLCNMGVCSSDIRHNNEQKISDEVLCEDLHLFWERLSLLSHGYVDKLANVAFKTRI